MDVQQIESQASKSSTDEQQWMTVNEAVAFFAEKGHPRTSRVIQRYCAKGKLESSLVETLYGQRYRISRASTEQYLAKLDEMKRYAQRAHKAPQGQRLLVLEERVESLSKEIKKLCKDIENLQIGPPKY